MELDILLLAIIVVGFLLLFFLCIQHINKEDRERDATLLLTKLNNETHSSVEIIVADYNPHAKVTLNALINNPYGFKKILYVSFRYQEIIYGFKKNKWELLSVYQ